MPIADPEDVRGDGERSQTLGPRHLQEDEGFRRTRQRLQTSSKKIPRQNVATSLLYVQGLEQREDRKCLGSGHRKKWYSASSKRILSFRRNGTRIG